MLNVDDVDEACQELERCVKLGLVGAFIPVYPLPDRPYRHPIYERLWWTAQDLDLPLLLHIATNRGGIPGCEFTMDISELTAAGRSTTDHWVRYSLSAMIFAGVFDRYPRLQVGSVEHEMAWIPHWLKQMDFTYRERPVFTKGWQSRQGMLPSDYWHRNMFVEFMEDDLASSCATLLAWTTCCGVTTSRMPSRPGLCRSNSWTRRLSGPLRKIGARSPQTTRPSASGSP